MHKQPQSPVAHVSIDSKGVLKLEGRLDAAGTADVWLEASHLAQTSSVSIVDVHAVNYCDSVGITLLVYLRRQAKEQGKEIKLQGLAPQFQALLPSVEPQEEPFRSTVVPFPELVGREFISFLKDLRGQVAFLGELCVTLLTAFAHFRRIRWRAFWGIFESVGIYALPIISLIGILTGCILAFQSLGPLRQFGVEIFAVNLTALAMLRELGPIMTAIVLAGRSGSAFAAEIATMKVNQELDALETMGIAPLRFLVVPRVLGAVMATPLLTIYMNAIGIAGGLLVMMGMGFSFSALITQLLEAVDIKDILGGIIKSFFFGFLVSSIGCLRGLQTTQGAVAVGISTTRSVVSGVILVIAADALFSALFYILKF